MSKYGGKKGPKSGELDEVEELLRATEDSMMLKLSVNTHHASKSSSSSPSFTTPTSSSPLDDELIRRFEALKKPAVSGKITTVPSVSGEKKEDNSGDVFARFSALKGGGSSSADTGNEIGEEDEVSKLIQWAVDAARLDPSLSGDDDEEEEESEGNSGDDDDDEEEEEDSGGSDLDEDVKKKQSKEKKEDKKKPVK